MGSVDFSPEPPARTSAAIQSGLGNLPNPAAIPQCLSGPDKQLNVSLSPEQYEWLSAAAEDVGETPTGFARSLIIEAVTPPPETDLEKGVLALPGWADSPVAIGEGRETGGYGEKLAAPRVQLTYRPLSEPALCEAQNRLLDPWGNLSVPLSRAGQNPDFPYGGGLWVGHRGLGLVPKITPAAPLGGSGRCRRWWLVSLDPVSMAPI